MPGRPSNRVRIALVGVFAVLTTALVLPSVSAQFPRQQPGPMGPGMRPNFPEGPRFPEVPRPNFPQMPQPPQPNFPQPRLPGERFGGMAERVWYCGGCKAELARGDTQPALQSCPKCGVHFRNGIGLNAPDLPQPGMQPAPGGDFQADDADPPKFIPRAGLGAMLGQGNNVGNWESDAASAAAKERELQERAATNRSLFWTVLGVAVGLGILLIIGVVIFAIMSQSGAKKTRRAAKRSASRKRYDDDDDEYIPRSKRRRYDD
jgi:hypothetical protein